MKKNKRQPPVSLIILNYNGQSFLKDCLASIKKLNYPDYEVILVDDASTDRSVALVKKNFPWVKVLVNQKNLGAPASFNRAARQARFNLLVKLDNDVIVDKNWLKEMVSAAKNPKVGVVGSKILHYGSEEVQDIGSNIDHFGYQMNYYTLEGLPKKGTKTKAVFYVSGCAMLLKKNLFEKAGQFDEKYFLYKDDLDLCWRIKLLGYQTVTAFESKIYHLSGVVAGGKIILDDQGKYHTTARKRYFGERNTLRTLLKNYSGLTLGWVLPVYFLMLGAEILFFGLIGQFKVSRAYLDSIGWNLKNLGETWQRRRQIQRTRTQSDEIIMRGMIGGSSKLKYLTSIGVPQFK
jgi:GT2 family glycosyltransferase